MHIEETQNVQIFQSKCPHLSRPSLSSCHFSGSPDISFGRTGYLCDHEQSWTLSKDEKLKNVAFSPYNTIHDGSMGSEFRKVLNKMTNEKVCARHNAPVVSAAYIKSLSEVDQNLSKVTNRISGNT